MQFLKVVLAGRVQKQAWTPDDIRELKKHSRNNAPVKRISRIMKRSREAIRQKARRLGVAIGHQR